MTLKLAALVLLLSVSPVLAQQQQPAPSAIPFTPLNQAQTQRFFDLLNEVSMPQRTYQQIISFYGDLLRQAAAEKAHPKEEK